MTDFLFDRESNGIYVSDRYFSFVPENIFDWNIAMPPKIPMIGDKFDVTSNTSIRVWNFKKYVHKDKSVWWRFNGDLTPSLRKEIIEYFTDRLTQH